MVSGGEDGQRRGQFSKCSHSRAGAHGLARASAAAPGWDAEPGGHVYARFLMKNDGDS